MSGRTPGKKEKEKKKSVADVSVEYLPLLNKQNRKSGAFRAPDGGLRV